MKQLINNINKDSVNKIYTVFIVSRETYEL